MTDFITQLDAAVATLKGRLAASSTAGVTGMIYAMRMRFLGGEQPTAPGIFRLHSPARQQAFLLGLLLATDEPDEPQEFGFAEWEQCVTLLNEAFGLYQRLFLPDKPGEQSEEWWRVRGVAGPVFMHYFNTSLIATGDQIRARIRACMFATPFA